MTSKQLTTALGLCALAAILEIPLDKPAGGAESPLLDMSAVTGVPDHFYDASGRRGLVASDSDFLVAVAVADRSAPPRRPAFLPMTTVPANLHPAAIMLESRLAERGLFVARGADRASLVGKPGVRYVLPLYFCEGSDVPMYASDRVVLKLQDGTDAAVLAAIATQVGASIEQLTLGENRYLLTVRNVEEVNPIALANALAERPDLTIYAEPDFFLPKVAYSPPAIDDPYYLSHQWHLDGDVLKGAQPNTDINVEAAWDSVNGPNAQGSPTVNVAIVDECVQKLHPDLFPNWRAGLDVDDVPYDDDPSPDAGQRHGTSCAGLAVAKGNDIGVRGVSPNSGLIGVKFFGGTNADTANAYYFCKDPNNDGNHADGAAVVSNSWGYGDGTLQPSDVVAAINNLATTGRNGKGVLVLFAAANNDHTINGVSALAQLSTVMAIGGTTSNNEHTEFSDVGPELALATPTNDRGDDGVRLPWLNITTVDNTGQSGYNGLPDLDYTSEFGGTSAATPIAAGVLALILSQDETMTAAQVRAIAQHTAVPVDDPYGRFDPITSHSHRLGFGRADVGAAVIAAHAGIRWPDRIRTFSVTAIGADNSLAWSTPLNDYAGSLLVRSNKPFAWKPTDGETYALGQEVIPGVFVIANSNLSAYNDAGPGSGGFFYAVFPRSAANRYGFGAKTYNIRNGVAVFYDNSEIVDPGWTHGGFRDEWTRGTPTASLSALSQAVSGSGPLAGTRGTRAINGNKCWGTDLQSTYNPNADEWLQTPLINLSGVSAPVFLEYWDWCLLETGYDKCTVEVMDSDGDILGYVDPDTGGDYDWTQRVYDLSAYAGQPIRVRFRLKSDGLIQRDGWFIDEVRITVGDNVPLPPTATDVYTETTTNTAKPITLFGTDPNSGTTLSYVIASLPANGSLSDPNAGAITSAPYTLSGNFRVVTYTPNTNYQGPDAFTYHTFDGGLASNDATVSVSVGTPQVVHSFPLNTNPGWLLEGGWAFGKPQGLGGDPSSGFTGLNVYGYNLAGAYGNNLPPYALTTLPFNCTGLSRVTVNFARWLGVESSSFDGASVEASSDGENWTTIWANGPANLTETAWSQQSLNIGTVADNHAFVQVRWVMGPTDSADTFAGWNVDDIQILAIGTPPTTQPPLARVVRGTTAKQVPLPLTLNGTDPDSPALAYIVTALPPFGTLSDPNGGVIAAVPYTLLAGGKVVVYTPDADFSGADEFSYRVNDGALDSNVAKVFLEVLDPASFPFEDGFEAGPLLSPHWATHSTNVGRILVTDRYGPEGTYHLVMDSGSEGANSLNELTLTINLEGQSSVLLYFDWKDFGDENNVAPASWTGSVEADAVAMSIDGLTWYKLADLIDPTTLQSFGDEEFADAARAASYQTVLVDLDEVAAAHSLTYTKTVRIRFQQFDNNPIDVDGIAIDNIRVVQGTDDPLIAITEFPDGNVGDAYGPYQVPTIGGDLPLVWNMPIVFSEQNLGPQSFVMGGVAQNWRADDAAFDYNLPFAFPFYGATYTAVKVGTDGWINFGPYLGSTYNNSEAALMANKRIAPMWDDLRTDKTGGDIFIDTSTPRQVTFRWAAATRNTLGNTPCNFSATLFDDGRIRFDYGSGNTPLTPTVGVSAGDNSRRYLASHDGAANLGNAASLALDYSRLPPGLSMDASGVVSGTPTEKGTYYPLIVIVDQRGRSDQAVLPFEVRAVVAGDFNGDEVVDIDDYLMFIAAYGSCAGMEAYFAAADFDSDGCVTLVDYQYWLMAYREFVGNPLAQAPTLPGDFDRDYDVDIEDAWDFVPCVSGPGNQASAACAQGDMNADGTVDLRDFAALQRAFADQ